jgi:hypothetical protein
MICTGPRALFFSSQHLFHEGAGDGLVIVQELSCITQIVETPQASNHNSALSIPDQVCLAQLAVAGLPISPLHYRCHPLKMR